FLFLLYSPTNNRDLHSFPTRRSSDLRVIISAIDAPHANRMRSRHNNGRFSMNEHVKLPSDFEGLAKQVDPLSRRGFFMTSSAARSEEHTSELQSRGHLVCRLLLEKKK